MKRKCETQHDSFSRNSSRLVGLGHCSFSNSDETRSLSLSRGSLLFATLAAAIMFQSTSSRTILTTCLKLVGGRAPTRRQSFSRSLSRRRHWLIARNKSPIFRAYAYVRDGNYTFASVGDINCRDYD